MAEPAEVVEVVEAPATAEITQYQPVGQVSIYRHTDPEQQLEEAKARARVLVEVVKEQNLAQTFGGGRKPHVNVEGWTFLASQFGLIPDIEWTKQLEDGWEARAQLVRLADGRVIAHGESECRRGEEKGGKKRWKNASEYEIRSMAQTRAVSKVCRLALSSIMVLAGFAATPAEEMDGSADELPPPKSPDEPHCPPCLAVNGELVAVSGPHDRKPFWRCTNKGEKCAGHREHNGKVYSWSGWHESFENSRDEWLENNPEHAGPQTKNVGGRKNHSSYVVTQLRETLNITKKDAEALVKPALSYAIAESRFDPEPALGEPLLSNDLSDDQLRAIIKNLDPAEADIVVAAGCELHGGTGEND